MRDNLRKDNLTQRAGTRLPIPNGVDPYDDYEPPYTGDEPLGTCPIHGDYWTADCLRCGR